MVDYKGRKTILHCSGEGGDWAPSGPLDAEEIGARIHLLPPTFHFSTIVFAFVFFVCIFRAVIFHRFLFPYAQVPIPKVKTEHPIMATEACLAHFDRQFSMFLICSQSNIITVDWLCVYVLQLPFKHCNHMVGGSIITLLYYYLFLVLFLFLVENIHHSSPTDFNPL